MQVDLPLVILECLLIGSFAGLIYGIFGGGSRLVLVPGFYYILRHFTMTDTSNASGNSQLRCSSQFTRSIGCLLSLAAQ